MNFNKNGIIKANTFSEYHIEPDGSIWEQCFYHNNPSINLFSSSDSFSTGVYKNSDMWFNFNRCKELNSFEFLYIQRSTANSTPVKYRWVQSKSPFNSSYSDVAPNAVTRVTTSGYTDGGYGGLHRLGTNTYFAVADSNNGDWWGATGCWANYQGGIPGYPTNVCTSGDIRIFVRVDNTKVKDYRGYDSLVERELIEI